MPVAIMPIASSPRAQVRRMSEGSMGMEKCSEFRRGRACRTSGCPLSSKAHRTCHVRQSGFLRFIIMSAKRTTKKSTKKATSKRTLIAPKGNKRYVRRNAKGQFNEVDDVGKSLSMDRRRKAKTK